MSKRSVGNVGKVYKQYTDEFRRDAVAMIESEGLTTAEVGRRLGVNANLLRKWREKYGKKSKSQEVQRDLEAESADLYWSIGDRLGIAGEWFTGEGLGTYNAGILQGINPDTGGAIESSGGWIEFFVYWTACWHSHVGYGVDDPNDNDIPILGRIKNETYFTNLIWDVNSTFRSAGEVAWRKTDFLMLPDNDGIGSHTQFQWAF